MQTQKEKVKRHLERGLKITSWDAIVQYHITRLSAYICELRQEGMNIITDYETNKEGVTYAVYWLQKED